MKRNLFIALMFLAVAGFAAAQTVQPSTDVLGAHLNYGRGCAACHAPHSGAYGNGNAKTVRLHCGQRRSLGRGCRQPVRQDHHNRRRQLRRDPADQHGGHYA